MDLWLSVNGERVSTYSPLDPLARSVVISLFTWRRAMPDDNSDIPMGWWGDSWPVVQNDRYGSRLWLLQRRKLTNSLVNIVSTYIRESLQWMLDDGIATRIDIDVQRTGINALGNSITIWRRSGPVIISFDNLWGVITDGGK
ncbi:phage GP46 family protein [Edwardsiella anguillarum]|uniref:phage GP46 family protein n=2 Tax=Edwardsiella anguillarum TaxID=1821960 RepID=UPI001FD652F0|nr:phage GP46 family protein [Edwardsiella anguillarum]UOU80316.1 phage GP46 family protein [Edwardsiella anguillarum]